MGVSCFSKDNFVQDFVKILGLSDKEVVSLSMDIDITLENPVIITIERYLTEKEAMQMLPLFEKYELVKKEDNAMDSK